MSAPFRPRTFQSREPKYRRNGKIRAREVRVIDEAKEQLGVMSLTQALRLAQDKGLDLVEIASTAVPPVCRIVNYGKLLYEEAKNQKESKGPGTKMKELQISPGIGPHDLQVKLNHAIEFLCEDMKVRVKLRFRGRQRAHKEYGFQVMNQFVKDAAAYGHADAPPKLLGERDLIVMLSPLPRSKRAKLPGEVQAAEPRKAASPPPARESGAPGAVEVQRDADIESGAPVRGAGDGKGAAE